MARGRSRSSNTNIRILSVSPGLEHLQISGCKLPTYEQVLLCFLAHLKHMRESNVSRQNKLIWKAAEIVKDNVIYHYKKANIDHFTDINLCRAIVKLYQEYCDRKKRTSKRKSTTKKSSITPAVHLFKEKLKQTMPLWSKNAEKEMESLVNGNRSEVEKRAAEEDLEFLNRMKTNRAASYMGRDVKLAEVRNKQENRKRKRSELVDTDPFIHSSGDMAEMTDDEEFCEVLDKRKHRRTHKVGTGPMFAPYDILKDPEVIAVAVRNNISATALSALFRTFITKCGGDPNAVCLSYASIQR